MSTQWYVYRLQSDKDPELIGKVKSPTEYGADLRARKEFGLPSDWRLLFRTEPLASRPEPSGPSPAERRAKIVDKVRKLLALSTSPNENEAARAAEKAQALLAEYNLSVDEVREDGSRVEEVFITKSRLRTPSVPWIRYIGGAVARLYFCKYFYTHDYVYTTTRKCGYIRKDIHSFVGAEHNIAVADMMFEYLIKAVHRLAGEGAQSVPTKQRTSYDTSFKQACSLRLSTRINARINAAKAGKVKSETTGTNLPALRDMYERNEVALKEHMEKEHGKMGRGRSQPAPSNSQGVLDGRKAGDSIGLDPQVSKTTASRMIGR